MTKSADKIIVALDVATTKEAMGLVAQLRDQISFFKVGLQLYTAAGPEIVQKVATSGAKVFLDLKLHDIPNTVAGAVAAAGQLGVQMMSVHLSGGRAMLDAAVAAKSSDLMLVGITLLTSVDAETLQEIGTASSVEKQVERLAGLGIAAGINGLVASPHEANLLRARFGQAIKIVTPGVRPKWSDSGDQRRFMTPREALQSGADYLVIGRPITAHRNPREAVAKILDEIQVS
jgi:orotidine-5'-phosphate decarboxylase